jgi:hypothetical protein
MLANGAFALNFYYGYYCTGRIFSVGADRKIATIILVDVRQSRNRIVHDSNGVSQAG